MADIYLSVDVGGSLTKVIYKLKDSSSVDYLVMSPDIEKITQASLDSYMNSLGWVGTPHPSKQLWVRCKECVMVLGDFAAKFDPQDKLMELKYENALWKVLGIIGLIVETEKIILPKKKPLTIDLAILLPWNEYSDSKRFKEKLEKMLADFQVRENKLKVKLNKYLCRPEGGGLALLQLSQFGDDWLQKQQVGILMFGHRNTTSLYFDQGELKKDSSSSPLLGFSQMLDMVIEAKSGLNREKLASAIFKARYEKRKEIYEVDRYRDAETTHPKWADCSAIRALATAKDPELRSDEIKTIVTAITDFTEMYWKKIERWLNQVFPTPLSKVVIGGGAAYHIQPELEDYFNCKPETDADKYDSPLYRTGEYTCRNYDKHFTPIIWGAGFESKVSLAFNFLDKKDTEQCLSARFVDCYGLYNALVGFKKKEQEDMSND